MRAACVFLLGVAIGWLLAGRREVEPNVQTWTSADGTATVTWFPGAWTRGG